MLKKFIIATSLTLSVLVTGCASVPMASPQADTTAKAYRAAPGQANIYVYRNETLGAALKMPVTLDGAQVGETASKTYIYRQVNPGSHVLTSQGEGSLTVNAQAGQNYFVWQEVKMGMISGGSKLQLVDESTGKAGVDECKLVQ
ncbi:DUF2846 domain-containing protein [Stenotrophobium rhamnosiphilum]|uniref:DUF2846 domain-containing protein n=1 Tax=Stenotrophobium rhamnosiphilum TaxID=2029166 RepID=UPI0026A1F31C